MNARTDAELIAASRSTPQAFGEIVHRHHVRVHRYVARRLGPVLAEEVVNDVFATAFTKRRRYDVTHVDAAPWLLGIATNLIHRHFAAERIALRRYSTESVDPVAPETPSGHAGFDPQLAGVLSTMRKQHRDVLFLFAVAELSLDEIAVALDVPVGTVKSWLSRARTYAADRLTPADATSLEGVADGHA